MMSPTARAATLLLPLAALVISGCAEKRRAWIVEGEGEAPIVAVAAAPASTPVPLIPWSTRVLTAAAGRDLAAAPGDLSPGARRAVLQLEAREEARLDLARQLAGLRANESQNLAQFASVNPPVERAIDAAVNSAAESVRLDEANGRLAVELELHAGGLALAVASAGGGLTGPPDPADGQDRIDSAKAEAEAQRAALVVAQQRLTESLAKIKIASRETIGQRIQKQPQFGNVVAESVRTARPILSERTPAGQWKVRLSLDAAPILEFADKYPPAPPTPAKSAK